MIFQDPFLCRVFRRLIEDVSEDRSHFCLDGESNFLVVDKVVSVLL
jgi:hypothetical protein